MRNQNTEPKKILVWKPGTQSTRQQKRNLRNRVRHIIDSTDEQTVAVGDRVIRSVCEEPDPEYAALHLFCAALGMHEDTGEPWVKCMTYLMDKFDGKIVEEQHDGEDDEKPKRSEGGSRLRRLLRSIVPRSFRQSDEAAAERCADQPSGTGPTQHESADASRAALDDRSGAGAVETSHH